MAVVAASLTAPAAEAGLVLISRDSRARVLARTSLDESRDERTTTEFGAFDEAVQAESATGDERASVQASQQSFVGPSSLGGLLVSADAAVSGQNQSVGFGEADSALLVEFNVTDQAEPFRLRATLESDDAGGIPAQLALSRAGGDGPVFDLFAAESSTTASESGLLEPGTYELRMLVFENAEPGGARASVDFDFAAGAAVPLPPAVLSGGFGLLAAAGAAGWSRWRRDRVA